jgi:hypothetical protein
MARGGVVGAVVGSAGETTPGSYDRPPAHLGAALLMFRAT